MKPIQLTIQAFGSYNEKTVIDFTAPSQNIFLITGDTGAGKSTIFDAIVFALYGETGSAAAGRDGAELQSQFAPVETEPYAELVFSEQKGEKTEVYTVRRVPRHVRPLKRKNIEGLTEEKEKVLITLPGGAELALSKKESDAKIEEIIGLTKQQFMQVAMIAQGEFMELLRASSDERKMIFRKLFDTRIYQDIVEETGLRRKDLQTKAKELWLICRTEAAHVTVPPEDEKYQEIEKIRSRIAGTDQPSVSSLENLIEELDSLCERLAARMAEQQEAQNTASAARDRTRDAYQSAKDLQLLFDQHKKAQKEEEECAKEEAGMRAAAVLAERIDSAYEVKGVYEIYQKALAMEEEAKRSLSEQRKRLPELEEEAEKLDILVSDTGKELEILKKDTDAAEVLYAQTGQLAGEKARAEREYRKIREAFTKKNQEYIGVQTAYYDEQAGILARTLEEGKPCPVCGSEVHPAPAKMKESSEKLTREHLEQLRKETEDLSGKMNTQSSQVKVKTDLLTEKKAGMKAAFQTLMEAFPELSWTEEERADFEDQPFGNTASAVVEKAKALRSRKEEAYQQSRNRLLECRTGADRARALIDQFEKDLPRLAEETEENRKKTEELLEQKQFTQEAWQQITAAHKKSEAETLHQQVKAHERKKLQAESRIRTLKEAVAGRQMPDLERLEQEKSEAEIRLEQANKAYGETVQMQNTNERVRKALHAIHSDHQRTAADSARVESLYNRLAGRITGSRMDIETFVQRYYLERILQAANLRFFEMSGGQYELRMYELEKAGEGKNRGLDLMVYSAVTGKTREIRTLSGGESFMAALCLALGMADQIRRSCASVNLDIMFIDEGFGSLDDRSRNTAVRILKQMAGGSRTIGIISHVAELRQEVDDILSVTKDETGSRAVWQS